MFYKIHFVCPLVQMIFAALTVLFLLLSIRPTLSSTLQTTALSGHRVESKLDDVRFEFKDS